MRIEHDDDAANGTPEERFGAELRRLRERAELTVRRLAQELHRSHSSIVEYERGRRLPGVDVVEQYEEYFGLERGALVAERERARLRRLEEPRDGTVEEHLGDVACPYPGLRAFEFEDAALFFGRESQIDSVLARLAKVRFVAVVGPSGSGKSSFVRAGLLARAGEQPTRGRARPRVALVTPGAHPVDELALSVSEATGEALTAADLREDPDRLVRIARRSRDASLIVAVDQFEELFTLCTSESERRCFVDALVAAWRDPASPAAVIVALRADFYGRVAAYPELAAAVVAHQALIGPLGEADLRRAIEQPAARTGLVLQPGLTETILEDLAGEPGALPLLSHALLETWKRRRRLMLTVSGYHEAGGVRGAIAQTAERTLHGLSAADQVTARSIFLRLTDIRDSAEPTRRRVDRAELAAHPQAAKSQERVFGLLADARLVTIDERSVMVAHESLIRHWPRLRGWVDADREGLLVHRRFGDAAREWDALNREPSALYRGARLASAEEWAAEHPDEVSRLEREFLEASQAAAHGRYVKARRRARRLRTLATGLAGLSVAIAVLAIWALGQRGDAQRQSTQATGLALASASESLVGSRPDVALVLAFEAYRASPRPETRSSVLSALTAARDPGVVGILHGHGHADLVMSVAVSGRTLATASADRTIRMWDVHARRPDGPPLAGHTGTVVSVAFSPDGRMLASASEDRTVRLWDVRTREQVGKPLAGHAGAVLNVSFSPDGRRLASTGEDRSIRLWDVRAHKQLGRPLTGHAASAVRVTFSPDGRTLASGGGDALRLWDVRTHEQLGARRRPTVPPGGVVDVEFSPDGRTLAYARADRTVGLWDLRAARELGRLAGHADAILGVAFSPDGRRIASSSADKTVRLWDVRGRKQAGEPLRGHTDVVGPLAFTPDGHLLVSTSADRTVRLWTVGGHRSPGARLRGHEGSVASVAISPDGRTLASGSADGTVRLWDVRTRKQLGAPLAGHGGPVTSVTFSADGRTLASTGEDGTIRLWDARTHQQLGEPLRGHDGAVRAAAFSRDGRMLASGGADRTVRLWDVGTHVQIGAPLTGHQFGVATVAFHRDGRTLASGSFDASVRLWDVRTRKPRGAPLAGHASGVITVLFEPDGRSLLSAGDDDSVRRWDVRTGREIGEAGHVVGSFVALSPRGGLLASAGRDKAIRLWDARTGQQLGSPLRGHTGLVESVAFSPDGRVLASGGADKTVRLWTGLLWRDLGELRREVCELVGSGLSPREWAQHAPGIPYRDSCR